MNLKHIIQSITGYWLHKQSTLPIGIDFFYDIIKRLKYGKLSIVFDVGANEGQTVKWIRHYQAEAKIYSFEPVLSSFRKLQENTKGQKDIIVENLALGDQAGQKIIRLFDDYSVLNSLRDDLMNNKINAREETISIETIDAYCEKNTISQIDLLKIDTEGFEMNVLKGAQKMLDSGSISLIYAEVGFQQLNTRNTYFADIAEFLSDKDYYFYGLYQLSDHDWIKGNYFGNALFIKKDLFKS